MTPLFVLQFCRRDPDCRLFGDLYNSLTFGYYNSANNLNWYDFMNRLDLILCEQFASKKINSELSGLSKISSDLSRVQNQIDAFNTLQKSLSNILGDDPDVVANLFGTKIATDLTDLAKCTPDVTLATTAELLNKVSSVDWSSMISPTAASSSSVGNAILAPSSPPPAPVTELELRLRACNATRGLIRLIRSGEMTEEQKALTLQQFLLDEINNLKDWPDAEFRKLAISFILQIDGDAELPLVGFKGLNPFAKTDPQNSKFALIFSLAAQKSILNVPLGTILATDRASFPWEQGKLTSGAICRLGILYYEILESLTSDLGVSVEEFKKISNPQMKKLTNGQLKALTRAVLNVPVLNVQEETKKYLLPVESLIQVVQMSSSIFRRSIRLLQDEIKALQGLTGDRIEIKRINSTIGSLLKIARSHYEIAQKHTMIPSPSGLIISKMIKEEQFAAEYAAAKTLEEKQKFCKTMVNELKSSIFIPQLGLNPGLSIDKWVIEGPSKTRTYEELMETLPFQYDPVGSRKRLKEVAGKIQAASSQNLNQKTKKAFARHVSKNQIDQDVEKAYTYDLLCDGLWREVSRKKHLLTGALQSCIRHIDVLASQMTESEETPLPKWIVELETLPRSPRVRQKAVSAASSSASSSTYEAYEEEDEIIACPNTPPGKPIIQKVTAELWSQKGTEEDTFNRLRVFPKVSAVIEARLKPSSNLPLEALLLDEARHHLFLLNQGMQILLTAILHGDKNGMIMAFPNLILDHHTFVEMYLKSQYAVVHNELSVLHSLDKLGIETNQPDAVKLYLNAFNQGALWERYVHTSKELNSHYRHGVPEALQLLDDVIGGKADPARVAEFAARSYLQLIDFLSENRVGIKATVKKEIEQLLTKAQEWIAHPQVQTNNAARPKGKGKARNTSPAQQVAIPEVQKLMEIIKSIGLEQNAIDSPSATAEEVCAHYIRLEAAKASMSKHNEKLELTAYYDRAIQTATYLFELTYRARLLCVEGQRVSLSHGFSASQKLLDLKNPKLNERTNVFFVGIARRYPEYFNQETFLSLLELSRKYVGVDEGFTLSGRSEVTIQKHSSKMPGRIQECQEVAKAHMELLAKALAKYQFRMSLL